jgi:hypothetical protein
MQTTVPASPDNVTRDLLALGYNPLMGVDPIMHRLYFANRDRARAERAKVNGPFYEAADGTRHYPYPA